MSILINKVKFHLLKMYVAIFVITKNLIGNPWQKVEGVYLPLKKEIGFNTLRWIINRRYEEGEINIIKNRLKKNDIVLEIGTGLGFVSCFCAKSIGSMAVYTFEANPINVELAQAVFLKNGVAPVLRNAVLAEAKGTIEFFVNQKNILASSLVASKQAGILVEKLVLNDVIEKIRPTFLVMDIEGAEYEIFKCILFQSIQKIQFELHPAIIGEVKCKEIFHLLTLAGFLKDKVLSQNENYYFYRQ